ncbi:unnamed protein product [Cunninghamella echinulata]
MVLNPFHQPIPPSLLVQFSTLLSTTHTILSTSYSSVIISLLVTPNDILQNCLSYNNDLITSMCHEC